MLVPLLIIAVVGIPLIIWDGVRRLWTKRR